MRIPIRAQGWELPTQACLQHLINGCLSSGRADPYICALLSEHLGLRAVSWKIAPNPAAPGLNTLAWQGKKGNWWLLRPSFILRPPTITGLIAQICREAIAGQVQEARWEIFEGGPTPCAECEKWLTAETAHIDHAGRGFADIVDSWLECMAEDGRYEDIQGLQILHRTGEVDFFREMHAQDAAYRPLCATCNRRDGVQRRGERVRSERAQEMLRRLEPEDRGEREIVRRRAQKGVFTADYLRNLYL